jgi:uncharacterized membrane protein YoaK (UPF0700 family)
MEFLDLLKEYGGYVALPVVINALMEGGKKGFKKFFKSIWGIRLGLFLPLVLGALGGLLLSLETIQERLLVGACLGALSHYLYKFVTVTIASQTKLKYLSMKKEEAKKEVKDVTVPKEPVDESIEVDL